MNKYLREIEIHLSKHFGKEAAFQFATDTKEISDYLYKTLKKNVTGNFGKIVVKLSRKEVLDEWKSPKYIDDVLSGVFIIQLPFEYDTYCCASIENKKAMVSKILQKEIATLPKQCGIDKENALKYLKNALNKAGYY
ncbi:hypothetical protein OE749_12425 [Aestuariibacter sp. AA17]|uniref:Uncharacterized protein n=1 Tax=Fluctibacter corallii TaxID=2984329 RepID=A0ABT3A9Z7_9ALTE|nr:hypothetical protein [Aestuariibacter sp. AA17]MCV2885501.1 hypothetical protein [Aestuariibacter sp. AA17]